MEIGNRLLSALGLTVIDSIQQGMIIMLVAFVSLLVLKRSPAKLRHNVLLICILMLPAWGVYSFIENFNSLSPIVDTSEEVLIHQPDIFSQLPDDSQVSTAFILKESPFWLFGQIHWIGIVWSIGLAITALYKLGGFLFLSRLKSSATDIQSKELIILLNKLKYDFGIKVNVAFKESSRISTPLICGYFKPIILFPLGLIQGLSTDEIEAILLHELAHLKRNDFLINIVINGLRTVYFYHPAFWWMQSQLDNEREFATDEIVLSRQPNGLLLAKALAKTQAFKLTAPSLGFAGSSKHQLLKRVNRIMKKQSKPNWLSSLTVLAVLAISTLLISQSTNQTSKDPEDKKEVFDSVKIPFQNVYQPVMDSLSNDKFQRLTPAFHYSIQKQDTLKKSKPLKFGFRLPDERSFDSLKALQRTHEFSLVAIDQDTNKAYKAILEIIKKDSPVKIELDDNGEVLGIKRYGKALKDDEFKAYKNAYYQLQDYANAVSTKKGQEQLKEEAAQLQNKVREQEQKLLEYKQYIKTFEISEHEEQLLKRKELQKQTLEAQITDMQNFLLEKEKAEKRRNDVLDMQKAAVEKKNEMLQLKEQAELIRTNLESSQKTEKGVILEVDGVLKPGLTLSDLDLSNVKAFEIVKGKALTDRYPNGETKGYAGLIVITTKAVIKKNALTQSREFSKERTNYGFSDDEVGQKYALQVLNDAREYYKNSVVVFNGKFMPKNYVLNYQNSSIKSINILSGDAMKKYPKRKIKGYEALIEVITK